MINFLRKLGFKLHRWESTHPSGSEVRCKDCGERRSEFVLWVEGKQPTWWETTESGDGSCSVEELPTRVY